MRHQTRDQRQRDSDVASEYVTERQVTDRAVLLLHERGIVVDDVRGGREVLAVSYQRPLGRTGGTGGIDDERGRARAQSCGLLLEPREIRFSSRCEQAPVTPEFLVRV